MKNIGDVNGHRAVEKNWDIRDSIFMNESADVVHEFLSAFDRERGNNQLATTFGRIVDDIAKLVVDLTALAMIAVAVGAIILGPPIMAIFT